MQEPLIFDLNSVNNPTITALSLFTEASWDYLICFVGTDRGMVEIWKVGANGANYLSKISTKGFVSHLFCDSSSPLLNNHKSLFVGHGDKSTNNRNVPLMELYNIGERFTMISVQEKLRCEPDYEVGQLLSVSFTKNDSGYMLYTIYEQFESGNSEHLMLLDIFSTKSSQRIRREFFAVPEYGLIRDFAPTRFSHHFNILFGSRAGKYLCADDVPKESFDYHGPVLPSFEHWFGDDLNLFPFIQTKIMKLQDMRATLDGVLLVDKLFQLFQPLPATFPPSNPNGLRQLFNTVCEKEDQSAVMKYCVVYYLLLFYSDARADKFVKEFGLSKPFVYAVNGFWALDNGNFSDAVRCLSDPSVNLEDAPDVKFGWNEKILESFLINDRVEEALRFIHTTSLSLWSERIVSLILKVFCKSSILEAIKFQRKFAGKSAVSYLESIFNHVFLPSPDPKSTKLLLGASLVPFEEKCLVNYCEASNSEFCHEFLVTYYIQQGRYTEALQANEKLCKNNRNPDKLRLLHDISGMLPPVIQRVFNLALEVPPKLKPTSAATLSQSTLLRGKRATESDVLAALQDNYVEETILSTPDTGVLVEEVTEMEVDDTFDNENAEVPIMTEGKTPNKASPEKSLPTPVKKISPTKSDQKNTTPQTPLAQVEFKAPSSNSVKKSPASPFMQPPFTPQTRTASPFANAERKTPADLKPFKSPSTKQTQSPIIQISRSPISVAPNSPFIDAPPLINRSPFASKPPLPLSSPLVSTGLGLSDVRPSVLVSPPKVTRSSSAQTQASTTTNGKFTFI
jgi:hypothetical protein